MLVDRHVARQQRERIGIARGFQLHLRQLAQQILAGGDAQIPTIFGDDEAVGEMAAVGFCQKVAKFLDRHALFHQQGFALYQAVARFLPISSRW